jgi:hypothetical protein
MIHKSNDRPLLEHASDEFLNEYLDNELSPSERSALEAHLEICTLCYSRLETYKALFTSLAGLPEIPLSRDIGLDLLLSLESRSTPLTGPANRIFNPFGYLLVVSQLVAAVLVIATRWSSTISYLQQIISSGWLQAIRSRLLNLPPSEILGWQQTISSLSATFNQSMQQILELEFPQIPAIWLTVIIPCASILWLVGNRIILSNPPERQVQ